LFIFITTVNYHNKKEYFNNSEIDVKERFGTTVVKVLTEVKDVQVECIIFPPPSVTSSSLDSMATIYYNDCGKLYGKYNDAITNNSLCHIFTHKGYEIQSLYSSNIYSPTILKVLEQP